MDRRAAFFLMAAALCAAMIPAAPNDLRWVPARLTIVYVVLALVSLADYVSARRPDKPPRRK